MFSALSEQLVEENAIMYPLDGSGRKFLNIEVRCIIENISYQRYLKNLEIFYEMNVIFLFFFFKILPREYTSSHSESFPSSLTAHGFSDCPITNKTVPHNFYICGDNLYSLILLPNNRYWSYTASVS